MDLRKIVILIPARYDSSRFPGKPLAPINGKPMVQMVWDNLNSTEHPAYIVTDDDRIEGSVKDFGGNVIRVDDMVESGSERIALAYERFFKEECELIINVQGDEPLLKSNSIKELAKFHLENDFDITTLVKARDKSEDDFQNPNCVKAIFSPDSGRCLSFSRSSVPYFRTDASSDWYQHLGVYSYKPEALKTFCNLPQSHYEKVEGLEQLRALENGLTIGATKVKETLIGVDTPEDIKRVEELLRG